jgi:Tfp pilus assembly PilM family ATPase
MLGFGRLKGVSSTLLTGAALPISVDFGTSSLKVLQIAAGEPPTLIAAAALATPENLLTDPAKRLAFQIENLPKLVKSGGFKGKRAVCSMPTGQTFCKHLQVQDVAGGAMADAVRSAVAGHLGCSPDSILCRHIEVGAGSGGKAEVIGLAASRATVTRLMDAIRACRLEPVGMHPECAAVVKCFDHVTRRVDDNATTTLYLDLGLGATRVIIANGKNTVFAKTIPIGGRVFDQLIAKQLRCDPADARKKRLSMLSLAPGKSSASTGTPHPTSAAAGMPALAAAGQPSLGGPLGTPPSSPALAPAPTPPAAAALDVPIDRRNQAPPTQPPAASQAPSPEGLTLPSNRRGMKSPYAHVDLQEAAAPPDGVDLTEPLETLTDEIAMCLRYHEALFPERRLTRTIFVGGEARHVALCQHIAKLLRAPAHVADPLARLARTGSEPATGVSLSEPQPGWAVPVGLCLMPPDL